LKQKRTRPLHYQKTKYTPGPSGGQGHAKASQGKGRKKRLTIKQTMNNEASTRWPLAPQHAVTDPSSKDIPGHPGSIKASKQLLFLLGEIFNTSPKLLPHKPTVLQTVNFLMMNSAECKVLFLAMEVTFAT
jgi:hypothetical protein